MSIHRVKAAIALTRDAHRTTNSFYVPVRQCDYHRCTCGQVMRYADEYADHYNHKLAKAIAAALDLDPT